MKKFLFSLFLVTFGFLFFNVNDVYAMTELEMEKVKDMYNFDDTHKKSSIDELNKYASFGWCIANEPILSNAGTQIGTKKFFCFSPGTTYKVSSGISFNSHGSSPSSTTTYYYKYELDGNCEFNSFWEWTVSDVQTFIVDKGLTLYRVNSGIFVSLKSDSCYINNLNVYVCSKNGIYGTFKGSVKSEHGTGEAQNISTYRLSDSAKGSKVDYETGEMFNQNNMGKVVMSQSTMTGASPYWRKSSCNQCAYDLLVQNSMLIKDTNLQCSGKIAEYNSSWKAYCDAYRNSVAWYGDIPDETGVYANSVANELDFFKGLTGVEWSYIKAPSTGSASIDGTDLDIKKEALIVKWGNKELKSMTKDELLAMLSVFYNQDYFCILGIKEGNANGPDGYRGGHVVLFAGCKTDDFYVNDSSHADVISFYDESKYPASSTPVMWMAAVKADGGKVSTKTICGAGDAELSSTTKEHLSNMLQVPVSSLEKVIENDGEIASYCKLMETDLEAILDGVNRDNLTGDQLDSLNTWEDLIADSSKQGGILYWIRIIVMWMGIALIVWAVLLYVSFWFDRANNFIDISFVTILTLGKLTTSDTDEEYTYGDKESKGIKTINSRILTKICVLSILVGVLVVSGALYTLISKLVYFVMSLISKGG